MSCAVKPNLSEVAGVVAQPQVCLGVLARGRSRSIAVAVEHTCELRRHERLRPRCRRAKRVCSTGRSRGSPQARARAESASIFGPSAAKQRCSRGTGGRARRARRGSRASPTAAFCSRSWPRDDRPRVRAATSRGTRSSAPRAPPRARWLVLPDVHDPRRDHEPLGRLEQRANGRQLRRAAEPERSDSRGLDDPCRLARIPRRSLLYEVQMPILPSSIGGSLADARPRGRHGRASGGRGSGQRPLILRILPASSSPAPPTGSA